MAEFVKLPEDVAKVYECSSINPKWHIVGVGDVNLTKITMEQAKRIEQKGWAYLKRKQAVKAAPAPQQATADKA